MTIRPGAYPWRNHPNAWRPAHIHFSLFGTSFLSRLVTQMYFPGDPLHATRPDLQLRFRIRRARQRLVAAFDLGVTEPEWALGFRFDIVLRGSSATPMESSPRCEVSHRFRPSARSSTSGSCCPTAVSWRNQPRPGVT